MSTESNKTVVRRYFEEALDQRKLGVLDDIVATDCIIHRPEEAGPIRGLVAFRRALEAILATYNAFETKIHDLVAEGDRVACRLSHRAVHAGEWTSRIGRHPVQGRPVTWGAIVIFRLEGGRIAEEWVCRDELGMLMQLDAVKWNREFAIRKGLRACRRR